MDVKPVAVLPRKEGTSISFDHGLGDHVKIKGSGMEAVVVGLSVSMDAAKQYRIVWWTNGGRYDVWVLGMDIE